MRHIKVLMALLVVLLLNTATPGFCSEAIPVFMDATQKSVIDDARASQIPTFVYVYDSADPHWQDQRMVIENACREWANYMNFYEVDVHGDSEWKPGETPCMAILGDDADGNLCVLGKHTGSLDHAGIQDLVRKALETQKSHDDAKASKSP